MKKFYFLFLFALIASIGNLYAAEKTVTWNFAGRKSGSGATTSCELKVQSGSASGTWKISASEKFTAQTGSGSTSVTLGSKRAPCTDAKLELSNSPIPEGAQIKKVSITANTNYAKGATFGLQIGGVPSGTTLTFNKSKTTQEFTESKVGNVVLVINTLNQSYVSLYSVSITYEEAAETKCATPTFNLTADATYTDVQDLVITSTTEGAQIEYKIEGDKLTAPITGKQASPATVHLTANDTYKVTATATKEGLDASESAVLMFTIAKKMNKPTFSVEEGTYTEAQAITLSPGEGGSQVFYTINDGTEQLFIEPIKLEEDGTYKITAYTAGTETLAKSVTVTKTYVINLPLEEPYILCEDAAWLTDGAKVIFVGEKDDKYYGMSVVDEKFITGGLVTISGKNLTRKDAAVKVFVVGRTAKGVTFNTDAGYLAAGKTATKGNLSYAAGNEEDCFHWTVSVANEEATVENVDVTGDYTNLQFNTSATKPRFGAYKGLSTGNLSIYLLGSTSSVSSMSAEGVKVVAAEGGVEVVAEEAAEVAVYTAAGQLVRQARVAEGSTLVNVAPGFYVVRANGTATKVIVR